MTGPSKSLDDVVIARIVKARGIRGEVACAIDTDFPERFSSLEAVNILMPDGGQRRLEVEDHWFHKDRVILKFRGYDTMTDARTLVGASLVIDQDDLMPLSNGEFFEHQLIGSVAASSEGESLGEVIGLLRTGGTDVLVVRNQDGRERMIPFADEICTSVDVAAKRITINPPDGLLEL